MEKTKNNFKIFNTFHLKIIAMIFMLTDHLCLTIIPENEWLHYAGRLAFPIFAFQIVEGFFKTKSRKKYISRMFIWALISEIPFNLMLTGEMFFPFKQNVLFTFGISLILLEILEKIRLRGNLEYIIGSFFGITIACIVSVIGFTDYNFLGVLTVIVFYWSKNIKFKKTFEMLGMLLVHYFLVEGQMIPINIFQKQIDVPVQSFAIFSLIPIYMYNGKNGMKNKFSKYMVYAFYPLHMLILYLMGKII